MTEHVSFNLIDEKWIPCIRRDDGRSDLLSLRETLAESHLLEDIAGDTPLQTAALYRLLIAILLRVYKPTAGDFDTWQEMWTGPTWDMAQINSYLDEQSKRNRFDLFDKERPFYQSDSDDPHVKPKSAVSMQLGIGYLQSPLFDHANEKDGVVLTCTQAARNLIAVQSFGLGGGYHGMFTGAPCSKGALYFIQGNTLKETLFLNMLPYPDEERTAIPDSGFDKPSWELDDPYLERNGFPFGYLDYLTWQNRKILLHGSKRQNGEIAVTTWQAGGGLKLDENILDPSKFYFQSKKDGYIVRQFHESQSLWINSYALFAKMDVGFNRTSLPPATFIWLSHLIERDLLQAHIVYRCRVLGQRKGSQEGKIDFFREERFPFPLRYLVDETLREQLRDALREAESIAFQLRRALQRIGFYLYIANPDEIGWKSAGINPNATKSINDIARSDIENWIQHTEADIFFWSALDIPFQSFITRLATEEPKTTVRWWRAQVRTAANGALTKAKEYAHESERAFHAIVEGQGYLAFQLNKMLGKEEKA